MIITIDGLSGSGKSTIARKLAISLGFVHLNSGALFRAVALKSRDLGLNLENDAAVSKVAAESSFDFRLNEKGETVFLVDGGDWTERLGDENTGALASKIALLPKLREVLAEVQRRLAESTSVVVEGRDSGTVIFPRADFKFYLSASLDIRAERRALELGILPQASAAAVQGAENEEVFLQLKKQIEQRDSQDSSRTFAPHRKAPDAIEVDTSGRGVDEVLGELTKVISSGR